MQLWKIAAFAILVICVGHLIYTFQDAGPSEVTSLEDTSQRHVIMNADYFPILCDILLIVIILSGLRGVKRRKKPEFPDENYNWLALIALRVAMLGAIAVFYFYFLRKRAENKEFLNIFERFRELANPEGPMGDFVLSGPTAFDQFIVIMMSLIIIVVIIMFVVLMIRSPQPRSEEPLLMTFPEYIIRRGEFKFDGDPRDVVINAYGATLDTLLKKGIKIPEHFTPWEFQQQVGNQHLRRLTQLFEKARYSTHEITVRDSDEALKKYELIKQEDISIPQKSE